MNPSRHFPAKLLVTGEFTVIRGGDALAIPFPRFSGVWEKGVVSDTSLLPLVPFLMNKEYIDGRRLQADIQEGWQFRSTIPPAYGLGSSGALSAAVLFYYGRQISQETGILQKQLAGVEDFFHGTSSGFDPLVSYTGQGYALIGNILAEVPARLSASPATSCLYVIDSGMPRGHIHSISWYLDQLKQPLFLKVVEELNELNRNLIQTWLDQDIIKTEDLYFQISNLQWKWFQPLITASVADTWQKGLESGKYAVKLCGKGGGGYYLLWSKDPEIGALIGQEPVPVQGQPLFA